MRKMIVWKSAIVSAGVVVALFGRTPDPAGAASCWANVICSFPGGSTYNNTGSWGNGSWPFSGREWSTCQSNCSGYLFGLDLQGMASERNVCGTVECTATYWLGNRPARTDCGPRRVQTTCVSSAAQNTDSQYAAKFVCGVATNVPLVEDGDYKTTINIHNPQYQSVGFAYKAALAAIAADGVVSSFTVSTIGSDAVQAFDCDVIRKLLGGAPPPLIDGFLVFQTSAALDVTGYYTAVRPGQNSTAIHIEKYPARPVPPHDPLCQKDAKIDLSDVNNWQQSSGNLAVAVAAGSVPAGWDTGRSWISYQNDGNFNPNQDTSYTYQLDFCSCGKGTARVTGDVKSDNSARGELNTTLNNSPQTTQIFDTGTPFPNGPGNFRPSDPAIAIAGGASVDGGAGNIVITVHNQMGASGVSPTGSLVLSDGHIGACIK